MWQCQYSEHSVCITAAKVWFLFWGLPATVNSPRPENKACEITSESQFSWVKISTGVGCYWAKSCERLDREITPFTIKWFEISSELSHGHSEI